MGGGEDGDVKASLLDSNFSSASAASCTESKGTPLVSAMKNGNVWTALAHIITGVIGSGVLSLAWSMSRLGWIAGPLTMLCFASVTFISASLLRNCYKSPDPEIGPNRNASFLDAVQRILGKMNGRICGVVVVINFIKVGIVYTITAAISISHHVLHILFDWFWTWLSQNNRIAENGEVKGSIGGVPTSTAAEKIWLVSQALGDIAFAFPFSLYFLEIQDTLKSPPSEKATMKKASISAVCITTFFYLCCGGFGYAAFGNSTPGNLLTGFGFYEPYWLIDFANACIVLHLVGGYQIFSQSLFGTVERRLARQFPGSGIVHDNYSFKLPAMPALRLNVLRICFRTTYVICITAIAAIFPYFNEVVGVAGAINFWPIVVYFPVEMYIMQKNIESWTPKAVILRTYSIMCLVVIVFAFIGSVKALISARLR